MRNRSIRLNFARSLGDHRRDLALRRDVGTDTNRLNAGLVGELARRFLDEVTVDIHQRDLDALSRQVPGACIAHAAGATSNERYTLGFEQIHYALTM